MASIRVDSPIPISDGQVITFKSPTDCSTVTGLIIYYTENEVETSRSFKFADAHGNDVGGIDLFAANVLVKVILDIPHSRAYVQNADTNTYIEKTFLKKSGGDMGGHRITGLPIPQSGSEPATKEFVENFTVEGSTYVATDDNKDGNIVLRPYVADADELEFRDHIKNKSNPHEVTPAQIGAAPAGYGLGEIQPQECADCNVALMSGWYRLTPSTLNKPLYEASYGVMLVSSRQENQRTQIIYGNNGIQIVRTYSNSIWGEWEYVNPPMELDFEYRTTERINGKAVYKKNVDGVIQYRLDGETTWLKYAEAVGGAPSGYGLGKHLATIRRDVNSATASGWHLIEPGATNSPNSTYYAVVRTDSVDGNSVVQTAWLLDSYFSKLVRRKIFGTWGQWEWENPPMVVGVEYCTTERHEGQPVYVKLIDCGDNPSYGSAPKAVIIGDLKVISMETYAYSSATQAYYSLETKWVSTYYMSNAGAIYLKTIEDSFIAKVYCKLKYVKR